METQIATATKIINARADMIYKIIADYRHGHPSILPRQYFLSMNVEEGGVGAGTVVNFKMYLLGQTQSFHSIVTEPQPGRFLVETDIESKIPTSFHLVPIGKGDQSQLTITTELEGKNAVESFIAKWVLQQVYREELELITEAAENPEISRALNLENQKSSPSF
jgi:hypothetical protein